MKMTLLARAENSGGTWELKFQKKLSQQKVFQDWHMHKLKKQRVSAIFKEISLIHRKESFKDFFLTVMICFAKMPY